MNPFARFPFFRFFLPLVGGIVCEQTIPIFSGWLLFSWGLCFVLLLLFTLNVFIRKQYALRYVVGLVLQVFWFFSGMALTAGRDEHIRNRHYARFPQARYMHVQLIDVPSQGGKTSRCEAQVLQVFENNVWKKCSGHIMLNAFQADRFRNCFYGDALIVPTILRDIDAPKNPGEFNYRQYMQYRNISQRISLNSTNWEKVPLHEMISVRRMVFRCRDRLIEILHRYIPEKSEQGVAGALLFGYKDGLEKQITEAYARTGTLHVLAVSGMHVAIIFWVVNMLLTPFRKLPGMKWGSAFIIIAMIWFYSLLSGLAPSIVRASVMFTCIVIGRAIRHDMSIYNNLFASACMLLCYDPWFLFDAGFQLSYLAVLGIVLLQPLLVNTLSFDSWIGKQIWSLLTVSVAAQVATFPISLYYFHQFPNVFFLANLIIIPLTTLIMYSGIVLIAVSVFAPLASLMGFVIQKLIALADATAGWMQSIPFAVTENIGINGTEVALLYLMLMCGIAFVVLHKRYLKNATLLVLAVFMMYSGIHKSRQHHQSMLVIQSVAPYFSAHLIRGSEAVFIGDSTLLANAALEKMHFQAFRDRCGIQSLHRIESKGRVHTGSAYYDGRMLITASRSLLFLDSNAWYELPEGISFTEVVLRYGCNLPLTDIAKRYPSQTLILDASLSKAMRRKYKNAAENAGIPCIDLVSEGAICRPL